jgi:hypothetical protein
MKTDDDNPRCNGRERMKTDDDNPRCNGRERMMIIHDAMAERGAKEGY